MRVELGDVVRTSDGIEIGVAVKAALRSHTNCVIGVVLETGLLEHDVVVSIDDLTIGPENDVRIKYPSDDVGSLTPFRAMDYDDAGEVAPNTGFGSVNGLDVPVVIPYSGSVTAQGGFPYFAAPGDVTGPPPAVSVEAGDEAERAGIAEERDQKVLLAKGDEVISMDGHKVGSLHRLAFDAASGRIISVYVRSGLLMYREVELDGGDVAEIGHGRLALRITKREFDDHESMREAPAA